MARKYKRDGRGRFAGGGGGGSSRKSATKKATIRKTAGKKVATKAPMRKTAQKSRTKKPLTAAQRARRKKILIGVGVGAAVGTAGVLGARHGIKRARVKGSAHSLATVAAGGRLTKRGKAKAYNKVYAQQMAHGKKTTYRAAKASSAYNKTLLQTANGGGRVARHQLGRKVIKIANGQKTKPVLTTGLTLKKSAKRASIRYVAKRVIKKTNR